MTDAQGTPPPLDLLAVEAQLRAFDAMSAGAAIPFSQETRALLAHCRALRAALEPLALARYADQQGVEFGIVKGVDMLRAQAVLAAARDGPKENP